MTGFSWTDPTAALLVGAHRGLGGGAPENTLAGARAAFALGVDFVETDLRATADGVAVALHDADFARVAGDPRGLAELDLATALRAKPDMPTVATMIDVAAAAGRGLLLDTKLADPAILEPVVASLADRLADGRVAFGVRSLTAAATVARAAPKAPLVGLLAGEADLAALADLGARWARLWQHDADPAAISGLRRLGLSVLIMAGRPTPSEVGFIAADDLSRLIGDGIDAVMLDDPALALSLRDGRSSIAASPGP